MSLPGTCAGTLPSAVGTPPCRPARTGGPPLDTLDTRLDLQDAFRVLPPEIQPAAVLFFLQERKQREIAKILGIGLPLVKYRIRKARELLAQFLRKEAP